MEGSTRVKTNNIVVQDNNGAADDKVFTVGERVEAIWSSDGEKYPGRIVNAFPSGTYDVLFDDGVKSRRKASLIFKTSPSPSIPLLPTDSIPPSPSLLPLPKGEQMGGGRWDKGRQSRSMGKNAVHKAPLLPVKSRQSSSSLSIPPPPPLLCGITNLRKNSIELLDAKGNGSESSSSSSTASAVSVSPSKDSKLKLKPKLDTGPPTLLPKPKLSSFINNSSSSLSNNDHNNKTNKVVSNNDIEHELVTAAEEIINTNGTSSPLTITTTHSNSDETSSSAKYLENNINSPSPNSPLGSSSTKKGFVYVQQPHYSVFDPPPVDLGKRHRRVHNYSMLARGPSLKKGLNANGLEELIDGECTTPTSTPSTSRSSSPSITTTVSASLINNISNSSTASPTPSASQTKKGKTPAAVTPHVKVSTLPTPEVTSRFVRKRRFLKSPPKPTTTTTVPKNNSTTITNFDLSNLDSSFDDAGDSLTIVNDTDTNTTDNYSKKLKIGSVPSIKTSILTSTSAPVVAKPSKRTPITSTSRKKLNLTISDDANSTRVAAPEFTPPPPLPPPTPTSTPQSTTGDAVEGESIPMKRLRKPSLRFSAEEGYVDIFSQKRSSRSRSSSSPLRSSRSIVDPTEKSPSSHTPTTTTSPLPTPAPKSRGRKSRKAAPVVPSELSTSLLPTPPSNCDVIVKQEKTTPKKRKDEISDEELLDIGEYTTVTPTAKQRARAGSGCKSPTKRPVRHASSSSTGSKTDKTVPSSSSVGKEGVESLFTQVKSSVEKPFAPKNLVHSPPVPPPRPLRQTSRGRIVRPPALKTGSGSVGGLKQSTVILDRLAIPKVQVLVKKCDSVISSSTLSNHTSSLTLGKKTLYMNSNGPPITSIFSKDNDGMEVDDAQPSSSAYSSHNKRWRNKKRWTKGRPRGLLPGIRSGMRVNDSHAMQILKRSRFQRRFDNRGRPKVVLLKGITKKRLKKIHESINRRKLKRKKISVATKFKDVRVDIINCVCGRTDEFGLMVQCEVCMCWQHGNCFGYFDGSTLPRFYVCQSCANPKHVRPTHQTEGIRQETYKKGILPSFPYAPKASPKRQKIFKRCNDLTKMIHSIENSIRQNRLKEFIATSEPEHKKLYQWSTPRTHPKDLIQRWQFNKYYKPVVKRLIIRHKGKPDYMEKLVNTIAFRDKLKKYSQAFEEAKLAISRKIGSRGLILVEKLSEQDSKINKIHKVKDKLDSELSIMPESMRNSLLSQMLENHHIPNNSQPPSASGESESDDPFTNKTASISMTEEFISKYGRLLDPEDLGEEEFEFETNNENNAVLPVPETASVIKNSDSLLISDDKIKTEDDNNVCNITNNENAEIAEDIIRFNLEQLRDHNVPILEDEDSDNWVEMKKTSSSDTTTDSDMIKLMLSKNKSSSNSQKLGASTVANADIESESEATLSGDTTVSVEDSEGGEEYWYNPITALNCEYDAMRKLLLYEPLVEHDKKSDGLWRSRESQTMKRDWIDDLDFYLNGDLGLGLDSISDDSFSDASLSWSDLEDDEKEEDHFPSSIPISSSSESENEEEENNGDSEQSLSLRFWQREILELEKNNSEAIEEEEGDEDWEDPDDDDTDSDDTTTGSSDPEDSPQDNNTTTIPTKVEPLFPPSSQKSQITIPPSSSRDMMFVSSDADATEGDIIDVRLHIENKPVISKALVVGGIRGENIIKLMDTETPSKDDAFLLSNFGNNPQLLLCKPCQDSVGIKWTWKQLNSAKGVNIVLEDTVQILATEVERYKQLGLCTLDAKAALDLYELLIESSSKSSSCDDSSSIAEEHKFLPPFPRTLNFEPRKLTEMCRDVLSKPRNRSSRKQPTISSSPTKTTTTTSVEEESILTLLSLSKTTPTDCNGENNVSELSIESLRKLTDRLQHNGPLSEDLAKAVTGQPLTNGKIGLQNNQKLDKVLSKASTSSPVEPICVRCKLQHDTAQKLYILITQNPSLVNCAENSKKLQHWCSKMSQAVEDLRLSSHAIRSILFYKVQTMAQRKRAEKTAKDLGIKITPDSMKRRLQIAKPEQYLSQLRTELVDALMPYATYFISRFTRKDEVSTAKKSWIGDMVQHYNNVKKTLKCMYSVENEEGRLQSEDKFYVALDNLRKSFDIVLTKKDIKMRRQNQSLSQSENVQQNEGAGGGDVTMLKTSDSSSVVQDDSNSNEKPEVESEGAVTAAVDSSGSNDDIINTNSPTTSSLVNGPTSNDEIIPEVKDDITDETENNKSTPPICEDDTSSTQVSPPPEPVPEKPDIPQPMEVEPTKGQNESNNDVAEVAEDAATTRQLEELEILTRLANYPIQVEDVNALLGIANEAEAAAAAANANANTDQTEVSNPNSGEIPTVPTSNSESTTTSSTTIAAEQPMELDDFGLLEENLSSSGGNLGDMDLINTIGCLGATGAFKGTEESDLLLNVFDDPIFSDPPEEPVPCSSRSIKKQTQLVPPAPNAPSLAKLTPEMCKGFLLDDIKAHQQIIDSQLDKVDAEIMELERRRGHGLKDKDDHKLFEMLFANMQILLENTEVLKQLTSNCVGFDNLDVQMEPVEAFDMDVTEEQNNNNAGLLFSDDNNSSEEDEDMFALKS